MANGKSIRLRPLGPEVTFVPEALPQERWAPDSSAANSSMNEQSQDTERIVLTMVSHELRRPLAAIRGYITTVRDYRDRLSDQAVDSYLESADQLCLELDRLVRHMLLVAQFGGGQSELEYSRIDLGGLIREVFTASEAASRDRRFDLNGLPASMQLDGESVLLELLFQNLEDNACKYSPEGSVVIVKAAVSAEHIEVEVASPGDLVPEQALEEIFLGFHRLRSRSSGQIRGSGMGLAICRIIAKLHHGQIWARSRPRGGLVVTVRLPLGSEETASML